MSAPKMIFLVAGTAGAYEESEDWIVCAYAQREDAEKDVRLLNERVSIYLNTPYGDARTQFRRAYITPLDAHWDDDWPRIDTHTEYSVTAMELRYNRIPVLEK